MGFLVAKEECEAVFNCEAGAVERVLKLVKTKMAKFQEQGGRLSRTGSACGSQPASPAALQVRAANDDSAAAQCRSCAAHTVWAAGQALRGAKQAPDAWRVP